MVIDERIYKGNHCLSQSGFLRTSYVLFMSYYDLSVTLNE